MRRSRRRLERVTTRRLLGLLGEPGMDGIAGLARHFRVSPPTMQREFLIRGLPTNGRDRLKALSDDALLKGVYEAGGYVPFARRQHVAFGLLKAEMKRREIFNHRPRGLRRLGHLSDPEFSLVLEGSASLGEAARKFGVTSTCLLEEMNRRGMKVEVQRTVVWRDGSRHKGVGDVHFGVKPDPVVAAKKNLG